MATTYDSKSRELAEYFLSGDPDIAHLNTDDRAHDLAWQIQSLVEDFIADERDNYDPTPYCSQGHRNAATCDCAPIADNE